MGWLAQISPKGPLLPRTLLCPCPFLHFPTALSYPAASSCPFLCCTTGFTWQADAISGIFALTLLARDKQGLGSRSGCSSLTMVMNPDSVCSSSLVLHRDSGWDCGMRAKANSHPGAQHCRGGSSPPCKAPGPAQRCRSPGAGQHHDTATAHGPARAKEALNATKNSHCPSWVSPQPLHPPQIPQSLAGLCAAGNHSSTASSCPPLTPGTGLPKRWLQTLPSIPGLRPLENTAGSNWGDFCCLCSDTTQHQSHTHKHPALHSREAPQSHRAAFGSTKS